MRRISLTRLFGLEQDFSGVSLAVDTATQGQYPELEPLFELFLGQSAPLASVAAVGCRQLFSIPNEQTGQLAMDGKTISNPLRSLSDESVGTLKKLAQEIRERPKAISGDDLLLIPARQLNEMMSSVADDLQFRALAVLLPETSSGSADRDNWRLRRALFDRGLVCIGSVLLAGQNAICFLSSDAVLSIGTLDFGTRGHITMTGITERGAFANQLFRYACVKLYALRHALIPALPDWQGRELFGLDDPWSTGLGFPKLEYAGFAKNDREFWSVDQPPIDRDLSGYFQEIPQCWQKHRQLLRVMFTLAPDLRHPIDAWHREVTAGGTRSLVAIHVRRGDYRNIQNADEPWFRLVPEEWYLNWLRAIWPTLREPLLFVGTDEPDAVLPLFQEFEIVTVKRPTATLNLPDHIFDFEILRRADYLAFCNSSFSRMAAILARSEQKCFLASFETQSFEPYQPWIDPDFWQRFENSWKQDNLRREQKVEAPGLLRRKAFTSFTETFTLFLDLSDLLLYLLHQTTLSGIQRVQCELLRNLLEILPAGTVRLSVLDRRGGLCAIETSSLLDVIEEVRSGVGLKTSINSKLRALLEGAIPCTVGQRDVLLITGGFWNMSGMGKLLRDSKSSGAAIGVFVHDIMPIAAPDFFEVHSAAIFVKGIVEALTFADFVITTSAYNEATLTRHVSAAKLGPLPLRVVPLAHELPTTPSETKISKPVAGLLNTDYVLCVGTLEVRKNQRYLFSVWKMLMASGRLDNPQLVFVGRKGWLIQDFIDQLEACNYLEGKIVILHNVSDVELDWLYRRSVLTMFPSLLEGWGLPVGESLSYGKVCLCSNTGGVPEVGGELADYIDPQNPRDGLRVLLRYLDDPELRRTREREISDNFKIRSWREVAEDLLESTQALCHEAQSLKTSAAIMLPPNSYIPVTSGIPATPMNQLDGRLSAELICVSGWRSPEFTGIRAAQPIATIQFCVDAAVGAKLNLTLKLAAHGRSFRVRICPHHGSETEVLLTEGSERLAAFSCVVEAGNLVSARLLSIGATLTEEPDEAYWMLKGVLYFDPTRFATEAPNGSTGKHQPMRFPATRSSLGAASGKEQASRDSVLLRRATMDESWRSSSFGEFLGDTDCYWSSDFETDLNAPIFADESDEQTFRSGCGNKTLVPQVGKGSECVKLIRRSNQFVSTSRFSEGVIFDRLGVWRELGYLDKSPVGSASWLSRSDGKLAVAEQMLAAAPIYEGSYLAFYNGNLHNYYHWLIEGLLPLDILYRAFGHDPSLKIALPKTVDVHARLDHRESFRALGLDSYEIVEVPEGLIQVREAVWVDGGSIATIPAPHLKSFQRRIADLYADRREPSRRRRLLVARRGPTRMIHNLPQVQESLSKYGFETVYLEGMSMKDQLLLFLDAEFVISPHGAGLSNLLFCQAETRVIEFMPSVELRPFFWLLSQKLDLVHGMQFCQPVLGKDFQSAINVDITKLKTLMGKVGVPS